MISGTQTVIAPVLDTPNRASLPSPRCHSRVRLPYAAPSEARLNTTALAASRTDRNTAVRQAMRELVTQLSLLNQQVGGHLDLRPIDIHALDLLASDGPLS